MTVPHIVETLYKIPVQLKQAQFGRSKKNRPYARVDVTPLAPLPPALANWNMSFVAMQDLLTPILEVGKNGLLVLTVDADPYDPAFCVQKITKAT